jgi:hypothetical protein
MEVEQIVMELFLALRFPNKHPHSLDITNKKATKKTFPLACRSFNVGRFRPPSTKR